jgi:dTDP-4-dehydrorhamnose reductase
VIAVNALFPNRLADLCSARAIRLVHYSTDCVYSGTADSSRGDQGYRETDPADARDLYGLGKLLGEPEGGAHLTLRTSMTGRELRGHVGLVEWFLSQTGTVRGFEAALFSGLTTLELARLTLALVKDHPALSGLWHVAGHPISKHDLLVLVKRAYGVATAIVPDGSLDCDRRLDGSRFSQATG